ncbi:MAG: RNA polymerase sigma factor SigE [Planctomycetota bacterium]|nr:RNA polymerase sigma factor [Planctomycetota bacterium]
MDDRPFDRKVYKVRATTRRLRVGPYLRSNDGELVVKCLEGDLDAFNELVERYQNAARNRAVAIVRDFQAAEDITQEAFVKAYDSIPQIDNPDRFGAWLMTIVQRTALDHLRGKKETMSLESMKEQGFEAQRQTRGLQIEKLEDREDDVQVLEALRDLRDDYREIIELKHIEGLSYKEIADRLGMTVSAVGEKLSRVRKMLERKLTKHQVPQAGAIEESEAP